MITHYIANLCSTKMKFDRLDEKNNTIRYSIWFSWNSNARKNISSVIWIYFRHLFHSAIIILCDVIFNDVKINKCLLINNE